MSQLPYTFDATQVTPQGDRTPVPAGDYAVILKSSDLKTTEDKTGTYIQGVWEITEGEHKGRQIFNNLNIQNKNEVATRIGLERLSALCHVVGRLQINDTAQLHGLPHRVKVTVSADNKYNEIGGFMTSDGRSPGAVRAPGAGAPPGPPGPPQQAPAPQYQQPAPQQPVYQQPPAQPAYQPPAQPAYQPPPQYQPPVQQPAPPAPAPAPPPPQQQYQPPVGAPPPAGMPAAPAGLPAWMQNQAPAPQQ